MDTRMRILVIHHDALIRAILSMPLKQQGYQITEVPNATVGLKRYQSQPTDLVIVDLTIPDMDDLDALERLCHDFP